MLARTSYEEFHHAIALRRVERNDNLGFSSRWTMRDSVITRWLTAVTRFNDVFSIKKEVVV